MTGDPNKLNPNFRRIEKVLSDLTPDHKEFGAIYPSEEIDSDDRLLNDFKHTSNYKTVGERSDAKLLEKTFTDMVEIGDWFGEYDLYGDDPDFLAISTFPTSEIDDKFNHVDLVGMINNETTGYETLPFAVDLTYNTDDAMMAQKFGWKHVHGKNKHATEGVSEFGSSHTDKDRSGRDVLITTMLPLKFRNGLKIPGFASVKYFEDKNDKWNPMHEKGRIDVMPRFIVGYSTDIADILSTGMPTDEYRNKYGQEAYQRARKEYENAERRAKWCTLFECRSQASDIHFMLERMKDEETRWMNPEELAKAKKQAAVMDDYFVKALELAVQKAQTDPDEMAAMKYADRDTVCRAITYHSHDTYIGGGN